MFFICSIPKHFLTLEESSDESKPDTRWKNLESELCTVYINKTTGGYVCPELALAGNWPELQSFLIALAKTRAKKRGDWFPADIPNLNCIDFDTSGRIDEIWKEAKPVETLDSTDFKAILKYFKLPIRDGPNPEDFALHEVRVLDPNQHSLSAAIEKNLSESDYLNRKSPFFQTSNFDIGQFGSLLSCKNAQ